MIVSRVPVICRFLLIILTLILISGCPDSYPENPYSPDSASETEGPWADVLASDSDYPDNVYLTENISFNPGPAGSARASSLSEYYDSSGYPLDWTKNGACGPPEGTVAVMSNTTADMTVLGSGGEAVWRFDPAWVIINGAGDDFVTFSNHNLLGGLPDGSWNELAHVYASEDGINWYISSNETYTANTTPGTPNDSYDWSAVEDLHGNNHCWANFRKDVEAEYLDASSGTYETATDSTGAVIYVSKYFEADDDYLGGDRFDLANFVHAEPSGVLNGTAWPADGKMRYLKLVDAPEVLDGQDWNPDWMTGARLMSAMGINVEAAE